MVLNGIQTAHSLVNATNKPWILLRGRFKFYIYGPLLENQIKKVDDVQTKSPEKTHQGYINFYSKHMQNKEYCDNK